MYCDVIWHGGVWCVVMCHNMWWCNVADDIEE